MVAENKQRRWQEQVLFSAVIFADNKKRRNRNAKYYVINAIINSNEFSQDDNYYSLKFYTDFRQAKHT